MIRPPSGTVTFLFSDIEGSTPLWERHPKSMEAALPRHDDILRQAITIHNGYVFKTVGDAFCAAFSRPDDALAAAIEAQRRLSNEPWPADIGQLRARIGIHSGTAVERESDYFGPAVNRAARIEAAAHGGQILLSQAVERLLGGELPEGIDLIDLGEHRLKGLGRPERLFQVTAVDLQSDFPSLALDRQRTNLPAGEVELFGRDRELTELVSLLAGRRVRLVTLTGPGGVGKTSLALKAAIALLPHFPDGVYQVLLTSLGNPTAVPSAVAAVLGAREMPDKPPAEVVRDVLREKHLLLLMDNFEHILPAAGHLSEWLAVAPGLVVLSTSRSPLRLRGEHEFPIAPLPTPDLITDPTMLGHEAAIALFMERARAVRPDLALTAANAGVVSAICRRLEGLPLAIELAAARARLLPLSDLLRRLESALPVLVGGPRDSPERQRSLRETIAWSYRLLAPGQQRLFRSLAAFRGGFSLEEVAAICETGTPLDALEGLEPLAAQSLIRADETGSDARFTMLETVREFALEELTAAGEMEYVRSRHLDYFTDLARQLSDAMRGNEYQVWFNRLNAEQDNVRYALQWALDDNRSSAIAERGAWLAGYLGFFWLFGNSIDEARRTFKRAVERVSRPCPARAKALVGAGIFAWQTGEYAAAETWLHEGLAIWRSVSYPNELADATHMTGHLEFDRRRYEPARALFAESLDLFKSLGNAVQVATLTADLGLVAMQQADYPLAEACYQEALSKYRQNDIPEALSDVLYRLGDLYRLRNDIDGAAAYYQESLDRIRPLNYKLGIACGLHKLGQVARLTGQPQIARDRLREALVLQHEVANKQGIVECLAALGGLALEDGQIGRAVQLLGAAEALLAELDAPLSPPDRDQLLRDVAAVREAVGAGNYHGPVDMGNPLSWESAVELGLQVQSSD